MAKSVLIIGGSYFIGKKIVDKFIDNKYDVYTLNRGTKPNNNFKVKNLICDRDDSKQMKQILRGYTFDIIVDVSGLNKKQVEILYNSLDIQKLQKYLFISSSAVYDIENCEIPFIETDILGKNKYWTDYGINKIEAENFLLQKFDGCDKNLIILRPPYVYGENNYAQRESFIFEHIVNKKPIIIPDSGDKKLQFIYSGDLANIIIALIECTLQDTSIYNVGNKEAISIKNWILACEEVVGEKANVREFYYDKYDINARDFFPFNDYDNVLNVEKINKIYDKETDFKIGLSKCLEWYRENIDSIEFKESTVENENKILDLLEKL